MKFDLAAMSASADLVSELLKALGNRHRLLILCQLLDDERSVGDLAGFLELRDSTVSQHLALLRREGLVQARRDGQTIWYSICSEPARQVLAVLYRSFCNPPAAAGARSKRPAARSTQRTRSNAPRRLRA